MTTNRAIGLGFIGVVVLGLASYFVFKWRAGATVPVSIYNHCTLDNDTVTIHVQDQVSWNARDQAYTLLFADSPFTNIQSGVRWPIPHGNVNLSGAVLPSVQKACSGDVPCPPYKYTVNGSNGCTLDPVVVIQK
jgi:hypothetical protein